MYVSIEGKAKMDIRIDALWLVKMLTMRRCKSLIAHLVDFVLKTVNDMLLSLKLLDQNDIFTLESLLVPT